MLRGAAQSIARVHGLRSVGAAPVMSRAASGTLWRAHHAGVSEKYQNCEVWLFGERLPYQQQVYVTATHADAQATAEVARYLFVNGGLDASHAKISIGVEP